MTMARTEPAGRWREGGGIRNRFRIMRQNPECIVNQGRFRKGAVERDAGMAYVQPAFQALMIEHTGSDNDGSQRDSDHDARPSVCAGRVATIDGKMRTHAYLW